MIKYALAAEIPEKARAWNVRYARWDGGPILVAKGFHSHWLYLPEPHSIYAMTHWYEPQTIDLLKAAEINWIWATWSVGFPPQDEQIQWQQVRDYVTLCHESGIQVTAYVSMTNMFRDLWLRRNPEAENWFQRDRQGRLIPYLAAYHPGRRTRFLACLSHPDWQAHLWSVAEKAVEAGVDGLMYDNAGSGCQCLRCQEAFRAFARERFDREYLEIPDFGPVVYGIAAPHPNETAAQNYGSPPDGMSVLIWHNFVNYLIGSTLARIGAQAHEHNPEILLYSNTNADMDVFGYPACQVVTTEDTRQPGMLNGKVTHNTGLLRLLDATAAGRKPVRLEYAVGHTEAESTPGLQGDTPPDFLSDSDRYFPMPVRYQLLAIAEAATFGASIEIAPEGYLGVGLYFDEPWAREQWSAISAYHHFLASHQDMYANAVSTSKTAVLLNEDVYTPGDEQRVRLLNCLSGAGLDFDVLFDFHLPDLDPQRYALLVLLDTRYLDEAALNWMERFCVQGGHILATGQAGRFNHHFQQYTDRPLESIPGVHYLPFLDDYQFAQDPITLAAFLAEVHNLCPSPRLDVQAAAGVLRRVVYQPDQGRTLVHLLNYDYRATGEIKIYGNYDFKKAVLFSPDPRPASLGIEQKSLIVSGLDIYAVVILPGLHHINHRENNDRENSSKPLSS